MFEREKEVGKEGEEGGRKRGRRRMRREEKELTPATRETEGDQRN